jgi:aspartate kinase
MVVQKFGGTSVADPTAIRRLIEIVRVARARDGRGPAVVVSAMSGVTDLLLGIASAAGSGSGTTDALARVEQLRERHLAAARDLAAAKDQDALAAEINSTLDQLAAVVHALAVLREVSPRTLDVIAAMGELLSSRIVAAALNGAGIDAEWVDARRAIVTTADHMRATPLTAETGRALRATVVAASMPGGCRCLAGSSARLRADTPRPWAEAARTIPARSSAPGSVLARSRSGPTSTACSPPIHA